MLDKRLKLCAEFVSGNGIVCDVGTDHAYLVAELLRSGRCERAIAADIADGPLKSARVTLEKYGLLDRVKIVKSDGLKDISPDGIRDIVIAGMGGELIAEIVTAVDWIKLGKRLILQPMTKEKALRKVLYVNGFEIRREKAVSDGKHIYTVMQAGYSGVHVSVLPDNVKYFGKLEFDSKDDILYAERTLGRIDKEINGLKIMGREALAEELEKVRDGLLDYLRGEVK